MELHGVTGSTYKHPNVRKKLPPPFTRNRIDLDGGRQVKRSWQDLSVVKVKKDDIVADFGRVEAVSEFIRVHEGIGGDDVWRVRLFNVMGEYRDFRGEQRVFVFAPEPVFVDE